MPPTAADGGMPGPDVLRVLIRDATGRELSVLAPACSASCVEVEAVVSGGHPPYQVTWQDGASATRRSVCAVAATELTVRVVDTPVISSEFSLPAQSGSATLRVQPVDCATDAGVEPEVPDRTTQAGRRCEQPPQSACKDGAPAAAPEELTLDVQGATTRYFSGGQALPQGRYRLTYVDGCATFGGAPEEWGSGWTIHGQNMTPGLLNCFVVGPDGDALAVLPGTTGALIDVDPAAGGGAFRNYADCVAANCDDAPLDFDFKGGRLGLARDGGGLGAFDDLGGESVGGRSPTYRLTRLEPCP